MYRPVNKGIFRASLELSLGLGQKKDDGEGFLTPCALKRDIPCCLLVYQQRPPGKASSNITCPNTEESASWLVCCYRNMLLACQQVSY